MTTGEVTAALGHLCTPEQASVNAELGEEDILCSVERSVLSGAGGGISEEVVAAWSVNSDCVDATLPEQASCSRPPVLLREHAQEGTYTVTHSLKKGNHRVKTKLFDVNVHGRVVLVLAANFYGTENVVQVDGSYTCLRKHGRQQGGSEHHSGRCCR